MQLDLTGKNAIVCGSTQGIGKAAAIEIALLGDNVTLVARNEDSLKTTIGELDASKGQKHHYICADFTDPENLKQKAESHVTERGPVHILVNNTGGPPGGQAIDANPEDFMKAISMHVVCNQVLTQAVVDGMKTEEYGRIINIISTSVKVPIPGLGVSNTTRGAVASWAKTLANELGPFGITVNNVLPGFTDTARLTDLLQKKADHLAKHWSKSFRMRKTAFLLAVWLSLQRLGMPWLFCPLRLPVISMASTCRWMGAVQVAYSMKRTLTITGLLLCWLAVAGQQPVEPHQSKNMLKFNPLGLVFKNLPFCYERVINDKYTASLGVGFLIPRRLPKFFEQNALGEGEITGTMSGISFTPEFKTFARENAPGGFYLSAYLRYASYSASFDIHLIDKGDTAKPVDYQLDAFGRFTEIGIGAQLGYQLIVSNKAVVDFFFFGPRASHYKLQYLARENPENPVAIDWMQVRKELQAGLDDMPFGSSAKVTNTENSGKVVWPFSIPNFRFGISFGYCF